MSDETIQAAANESDRMEISSLNYAASTVGLCIVDDALTAVTTAMIAALDGNADSPKDVFSGCVGIIEEQQQRLRTVKDSLLTAQPL